MTSSDAEGFRRMVAPESAMASEGGETTQASSQISMPKQ